MLQSYKHFFKLPPHFLNCVKTNGFVGILTQNPVYVTQFEQIAAVDNLTKLHLSMSKSWLTPDYFFFVSLLRKYLRSYGVMEDFSTP